VADSVLNLLFTIKKKGDGDKATTKSLNEVGKSVKQVRKEFKDMQAVGKAFNAGMFIITAGLKAVSDSAKHLGRNELATAFDRAAEAGKDLQDTLVTLKVGGRDAIAWVTDAANGLANLADLVNVGGIAFAQMTGAMSDSEAAARATALVYQDVKLSTEQIAQAALDAKDPLDESARLNRDMGTAAEAAATMSALAAQKVYDYGIAMDKAIGPASDLAFALGELNTQTLFTAASAGLNEDQQIALGVAMGIIDEKVLAAKQKLDELRVQYGVTADASKNSEANIYGYTEAVIRMNMELDGSLQRLRDIQAELNSMPGEAGGRVGGEVGADGKAMGGPVSAGTPYMVGERGPEMFVPNTGGTIIPNHVVNNNFYGGISVSANNASDFTKSISRTIGADADRRSRT